MLVEQALHYNNLNKGHGVVMDFQEKEASAWTKVGNQLMQEGMWKESSLAFYLAIDNLATLLSFYNVDASSLRLGDSVRTNARAKANEIRTRIGELTQKAIEMNIKQIRARSP
ncbi:MAG: hypothetical protein AB1468_00495 [Candidatus Micrarchaeota archaeon]